MPIELVNSITKDILVKVWRLGLGWVAIATLLGYLAVGRLLFDPQILWWLEIVPEDRNNLLNLVVCVSIHKEIRVLGRIGHTNVHLELAAPRHLPVSCEALVFEVWVEFMNHLCQLI